MPRVVELYQQAAPGGDPAGGEGAAPGETELGPAVVGKGLNQLAELYVAWAIHMRKPLLTARSGHHCLIAGAEHVAAAVNLGALASLTREWATRACGAPRYARFGPSARSNLVPTILAPHEYPGPAGAVTSEGVLRRAKPLFERALSIREKKLGPDHLLVSETLDALARLHV